MKKIFAILILSLTVAWAPAQTFEFDQVVRTSINGTYKSFLFVLPEVDQAQVEEDWKKWMEGHNAKTRYDKKNKLWYAKDVSIPRLTNSTINVYANIFGEEFPEKRTSVIVWFALGEDYIPSNADSLSKKDDNFDAQYAIEALTIYAMTTSKNQAQTILDTESNRLDEFAKDLKNLQKDQSEFLKDLEKAKSEIVKNEGNIEDNEQEQSTKIEDIESQKKALKDIESPSKSDEKLLSSLERDLRKLQKDHEDYLEEIEKAESSIALTEMFIEINARDQENKTTDIEKQREVVKLAEENVKKFSN